MLVKRTTIIIVMLVMSQLTRSLLGTMLELGFALGLLCAWCLPLSRPRCNVQRTALAAQCGLFGATIAMLVLLNAFPQYELTPEEACSYAVLLGIAVAIAFRLVKE